MSEEFFITTPIYYINDKPHIGHVYTTFVADTLARFHRQRGARVRFLVGTDENAQKTVTAAQKSNEDIVAYTNRMAGVWQETWKKLGIENTDFIRTTEERHIKVVNEIWKKIWDKGDIYKGKYEGLYCKGCEAFKKESDLVGGVCPDHKVVPEHIVEENYFFALSKYQDKLLKFYESHPTFVVPDFRFNEIKSFVTQGLEDISVSRATQEWGIPVPNDPTHVIYVWFDALINYASADGLSAWQNHPADLHCVGKDIGRFHAVIWPAMLMSAGLPLPGGVGVNGFFTTDGVKISKSLGNAIDPLTLPTNPATGFDTLRYFLLREIPYGGDGDFSFAKYHERMNGELANGVGNFVARVWALAEKHDLFGADTVVSDEVRQKVEETRLRVEEKIRAYKFNEALAVIWELIHFGDGFLNTHKPWETNDTEVLFSCVYLVEQIGELLVPFLPNTAQLIHASIKRTEQGTTVERGPVLFPRMEAQ